MSWEEEPEREDRSAEFAPILGAFHEQLMACLEECAAGRVGLFLDREYLGAELHRPWPEAARLRELAFALQGLLAQNETSDTLCEQFLDLCSIHGESNPGEARLARAFLAEISGSRS